MKKNKNLIAEIISVGTEILLGEIIDTNAAWIAIRLRENGLCLYRKTTVGDNLERLSQAVKTALLRADLVFLTGGLGPTEDDVTREAIAIAFDEELKPDKELETQIQKMFERRGRKMAETNLKQAQIIQSANPLPNKIGTACGWQVKQKGKTLFALPGPPVEMKQMWQESVVNLLPLSELKLFAKTIRTSGIGESDLVDKIPEFTSMSMPGVGTYARDFGVDIRIAAMVATEKEGEKIVLPVADEIYKRLQSYVYGFDEETLVQAIMNLLNAKGQKIALMESVTGGTLASEFTRCKGISSCFIGSVTAYQVDVKRMFGVPAQILEKYGVVSEQVAKAMANEIKNRFSADWGIATTGVAGPDSHGGQPPGTAWIAVAGSKEIYTRKLDWPGTRPMIIARIAKNALQLLWSILQEKNK
jgi:nicotinamide-nucleotide amidase